MIFFQRPAVGGGAAQDEASHEERRERQNKRLARLAPSFMGHLALCVDLSGQVQVALPDKDIGSPTCAGQHNEHGKVTPADGEVDFTDEE